MLVGLKVLKSGFLNGKKAPFETTYIEREFKVANSCLPSYTPISEDQCMSFHSLWISSVRLSQILADCLWWRWVCNSLHRVCITSQCWCSSSQPVTSLKNKHLAYSILPHGHVIYITGLKECFVIKKLFLVLCVIIKGVSTFSREKNLCSHQSLRSVELNIGRENSS